MNQDVKREIRSRMFSIVLTMTFLITMTYLWFGPRVAYNNNKGFSSLGLAGKDLVYYDLSEGIYLENAVPVTDTYGLTTTPYVFGIKNNGKRSWEYQIQFIREEPDEPKALEYRILEYNYLRYAIQKDDEDYSEPKNIPLDGIIYIDELEKNETSIYHIKIWIDENAGNEVMNTYFNGKVGVSPLVRQQISMK